MSPSLLLLSLVLGHGLAAPQPAEDAQMGDGLRLSEPMLPPLPAVTCPSGDTLPGIDISKWQGDVDWNAIAADGTVFAFVRVSDGLNTHDQYFDKNWAEARAAGVITGVYQFFRPSQDPIAQADLLLSKMGALGPDDLPPVIDVEATGGLGGPQIVDAVHQWVDRVEGELGVMPIVYTGRYFWQDNVGTSDFSEYPLWIAHYTAGCPNIPSQWDEWVFHQYTDSGSVAGVSGGVDSNTFNGDLAALLDFAGGGASSCGDGVCSASEDEATCPGDCPPCGTIPSDGGVVDDGDACLELLGPAQYWRQESAGHGGSLRWTMTTDLAQPSNYARWSLNLDEAGEYRVEAYVIAQYGFSELASYEIEAGGITDDVTVDQSSASGWTPLGDFDFDAGGQQWVRLDDNTGEPNSASTQLVVDALRLTRLDEGGGGTDTGGEQTDTGGEHTDTGGEQTDTGETTGDGGGDADGDETTEDDTAGSDDGDGDGQGDAGGDGTVVPPFPDDPSGCGCRSGHRGTSPWGWLVLILFRPRRRSAGGTIGA